MSRISSFVSTRMRSRTNSGDGVGLDYFADPGEPQKLHIYEDDHIPLKTPRAMGGGHTTAGKPLCKKSSTTCPTP